MSRFLVFSTQAEALDAEAKISNRARELYVAFGYGVDEHGAVIGKNAASGELEPEAQRTQRFAVPAQRLDGAWVLPHPDSQPAADVVIDAQGTTVQQYVMQDLGGAVVQDYIAGWFASGWAP
jgi:hypothetical protein